MGVLFTPGQVLGRGDLDIFLTNAQGNPVNAAEITYSLAYVDPGPPEVEVPIPPDDRTPVNPQVGEYYASVMIPPNAASGTYRIRWTFKELVNTPAQQVVQEFAVSSSSDGGAVADVYSAAERAMVDRLRMLLRDHRPDQFYHFRPPEHEGQIGQYNRVFGQIWEDEELKEYIERGVDSFDMRPPATTIRSIDNLEATYPEWRTAILWAAISHACMAMALNWIADEFDYSIGGVSLSIERSSKYESIKSNAEGQFDKAADAKTRTVKYIKGLQQPRFGIGIRSAFGPHVGRGVLSPRHFLVVSWFLLGHTLVQEVLHHSHHLSSLFS